MEGVVCEVKHVHHICGVYMGGGGGGGGQLAVWW